jgi:hypothetical protein
MGERVCAQEVDARTSAPKTRKQIGVKRPNFAMWVLLIEEMNAMLDSGGSKTSAIGRIRLLNQANE